VTIAQSALAHALAGNFEVAAERAKAARANAEARKSEGKPEKDASDSSNCSISTRLPQPRIPAT
jgi:hypothetical protein